jgi:subtilisin family serine protease
MVKYAPDTDSATIENIETENGLILKNQLLANWRSYYVAVQDSTVYLVQALLEVQEIIDLNFNYALDFFMAPLDSPNDPHYTNDQWYIPDIHVDDAWEITTGDPTLVVGVLDCGVDYTNPDLDVENNPAVYPDNGCYHGTWMTSLIAARTNNELGTAGIAGGWDSSPVTVKNYKLEGEGYILMDLAANALNYAVGDGIRLFNCSWGQDQETKTCQQMTEMYHVLTESIQDAYDHYNAVIFAAVGNNNADKIAYPACLEDYVFAVGATDHDWNKWTFGSHSGSAYGENTFISAPGVDIIYPLIGPPYDYDIAFGATSPSCAIATGVAALILSENPCISNTDLREILINSADKVGGYDYD